MAWVLTPPDADFQEVVSILGVSTDDPSDLAGQLKSDEQKKRWDRHEVLAALVGGSPRRATRVKEFLRGLADIGAGRETPSPRYRKNDDLSAESTEVWVFGPVDS